MTTEKKVDKYKRKSLYAPLKPFCAFAGENDFIEITEWKNSEGFDVEISSKLRERFQLTYGEYYALKMLIKIMERR